MASFLAISPATVSGLAVRPSAAFQALTTTGTTATSAAVVADSTTVTLSAAARALFAISGTTDVENTALDAALSDGLAAPTAAVNDALASERRAFEATLALQALLDDPGLRAIKNQADPLYSALIAASHLSDFVPAAPLGVNLSAIAAEIPAPVRPVAVSRAIDFYRETAGDTGRQLAA